MRIGNPRLLPVSLLGLLLGFVLLILSAHSAAAQATAPNEWTWQGGSDTANQPGLYGTEGTPAAGNIPSSRIMPATATDSQGNLWLFGGGGSNYAGFNDLWEFNPSTKQWSWGLLPLLTSPVHATRLPHGPIRMATSGSSEVLVLIPITKKVS
jgi:hypothetical protein